MALRKVECAFCSEVFETDKSAATYCSVRCRRQAQNRARREKNAQRTYTCAWCGETFKGPRKKKYCSELCRMKANGRLLPKPKEREKPKMTSSQIDAAARKEGLSYGKYVAKYGL